MQRTGVIAWAFSSISTVPIAMIVIPEELVSSSAESYSSMNNVGRSSSIPATVTVSADPPVEDTFSIEVTASY